MWRTSTRAPCSTSLSAAKVRPAAAARWSGVSPTSSVASTSVRSSSSSTDSTSTAPTVQGDAHTCEKQAWSRPTRSRSRPAWSAVACGLWPRANPVGPGFEPCVAYCQRSGGVACSCRHRACSGPHPRRVRHAARARPPAPPPRGCCSRQRRRGGAATLVYKAAPRNLPSQANLHEELDTHHKSLDDTNSQRPVRARVYRPGEGLPRTCENLPHANLHQASLTHPLVTAAEGYTTAHQTRS